MHGKSHTVHRLNFHLPGRQIVYFKEGEEDAALDKNAESKLTAFFELNQVDAEANSLLYKEIPLFYVWNGENRKWIKRKRFTKCVVRLYAVSPRDVERYSLYLLLLHVRGPKSFEDLRTVNRQTFASFREAAADLQ